MTTPKSDRVQCCDAMKEILSKFDKPFYWPIRFVPKTHDLVADELAVTLYKTTPAGNISKRGSATVFLNYCPWCGKKLREIERRERKNEKDT